MMTAGAGAGGLSCKPDPAGCGVIFGVLPNGSNSQEIVLHAFCEERDCRDGFGPLAGVFLDEQGNLFGTTELGGGNDTDGKDADQAQQTASDTSGPGGGAGKM